jgi:hypothetical protein
MWYKSIYTQHILRQVIVNKKKKKKPRSRVPIKARVVREPT